MAERQVIDACGAFCPGPLMELIGALRHTAIGDEVEVWSTDKGSAADIPAWIEKVHHELVSINEANGHWSIVIRKAK